MSIEAMKQALEALERIGMKDWVERKENAITTLRQALVAAQAAPAESEKQEPVAWINAVMEQAQVFASAWSLVGGLFDGGSAMDDAEVAKNELRQMLATPPKREFVGLTDEEIEQGYETTGHYQTLRPQDRFAVFALARAIEAKLKAKNGFPQEEKNT